MIVKCCIYTAYLLICSFTVFAQTAAITGKVTGKANPLAYASVGIPRLGLGTLTNRMGIFEIKNIPYGTYQLKISCIGYATSVIKVNIDHTGSSFIPIELKSTTGTLNEVVVTGVSRGELVKEDPVPVITVSSQKISRTVGTNIIDMLVKNVPGLNAVKTGPNISKPFIRGLGYTRVLTLYDGVRQEGQQWGDEHGIEVDAYNIERAEVIKGPSSLMYGSDALAGVVSLIPVMPDNNGNTIHGRYLSEYQSNNGLIGNGIYLDHTVNQWSYAIRGSYRLAKNYTDPVDGRVYNTNFRETNASVTVQYKTAGENYANLNMTLYNDLQGIPDGSRDSLTRRFTRQIYEGENDNIKNRPVAPGMALNTYKLSPLHQHIQHYRIYSKSHYQIGRGDVDLLLAFQQNIRREYDHPTEPRQAGMYVRLNTFN
jgi:iron complex outermembrane receptor protein